MHQNSYLQQSRSKYNCQANASGPARRSYSWTTWMKPARLGGDFNRKNSTMQSLVRAWASPTIAKLHCADVCVNVRMCLWPHIVHFKSAFKYFPKIEHPCALGKVGYCQSAALATIAKSSSLSTHSTLLLVCHSSYAPTFNGRLLADCTKLYTPG